MFNERPNITSTVTTSGPYSGYLARSLCLVDGFPAEVRIKVYPQRAEHGEFVIGVFDPIKLEWAEIYELSSDEVGHLPSPIGDDPATLMALNNVANRLWIAAQAIMIQARQRQLVIDTESKAAARIAMDHASQQAQWVPPYSDQVEIDDRNQPEDIQR